MSAIALTGIVSLFAYFNGSITELSVPVTILLLSVFVIYRHKANIKRIIEGKESRIQWMGKAPWEK